MKKIIGLGKKNLLSIWENKKKNQMLNIKD
jgi:hypothetical protein